MHFGLSYVCSGESLKQYIDQLVVHWFIGNANIVRL